MSIISDLQTLVSKYERTLSEVDTQVLFVERVLLHIGWDVNNPSQVRRAGRNSRKDTYDLLLYDDFGQNTMPRIVIECKSLSSKEFRCPEEKGRFRENPGILKQKNNSKHYEQKYKGDGLAQVRRYYVNGCTDKIYDTAYTIPVFTNGKQWVIFDGHKFRNNPTEHVRDNDCLVVEIGVSDFLDKLKTKIGYDKLHPQKTVQCAHKEP